MSHVCVTPTNQPIREEEDTSWSFSFSYSLGIPARAKRAYACTMQSSAVMQANFNAIPHQTAFR